VFQPWFQRPALPYQQTVRRLAHGGDRNGLKWREEARYGGTRLWYGHPPCTSSTRAVPAAVLVQEATLARRVALKLTNYLHRRFGNFDD